MADSLFSLSPVAYLNLGEDYHFQKELIDLGYRENVLDVHSQARYVPVPQGHDLSRSASGGTRQQAAAHVKEMSSEFGSCTAVLNEFEAVRVSAVRESAVSTR